MQPGRGGFGDKHPQPMDSTKSIHPEQSISTGVRALQPEQTVQVAVGGVPSHSAQPYPGIFELGR